MFEFPSTVAALNREQRVKFYMLFANEPTTANRAIWSDHDLALSEQVDQMK